MGENILLAADGVVFSKSGGVLNVLLAYRKKEPFGGKYAIMGGLVRKGERPEDVIMRRVFEETGIPRVQFKRMKSYGEKGRDPRGKIITIAFVAELPSTIIVKDSDDEKKSGWFPVKDMPELAFDHKRIIEDAIIFAKRHSMLK